MKKSIQIKALLCLSMIFSFSFVDAQNEPQCGTVATAESEKYFQNSLPQIRQFEQEYYQLSSQRSSTAVSSVPVKVHILRTDAGFGGLSESDINSIIADMNVFYANAFLEFFICDAINYIDSSEYYDYSIDEEDALTLANNTANVINIYFANSVSTAEGGGLCGYAYFPGGPEIIMMDNSCAINGSTMSHEMGHFFGLSHTHGNTNGTLTTELVDGSNCDTDGDFICDTAADPQLGYGNVNTSCNYVGTATDANGEDFVPDPLNLMSYSRKECRTLFSSGQYARIYGVYQASRSVMACPTFNVDLTADFTRDCGNSMVVDFTDTSIGATAWEWDVDGDDIIDYTTQNPSHTYSSQGEYDVTLTISNGSESLTKVYQEYIIVGGETTNTTQIILTLTTDDWPNETSWVFRDSAGSALYTSPTYVDGDDDFTTFTETFDISTNECYTFEMIDSYGDGICCFSGNGSYTLETLEGAPVITGGDYGFGEITYMANAVLNVNDYFSSNEISVFPNPTQDILNIKLANTNDLPDSYTVYNMLGQIITSKKITQVDDLNLQTDTFSNGVYYLELTKENNSSTIPFIKN
ncbi:T9SS type A sorting domain-containing protein [Psychroserpens sp. AS72]|uniref:T9SS type A sorting domain-containing protein n=1 Tax=Psychroserpens sp. AS72 TaxID=3135775 RepID=UPI00316F659F